LRPVECVSSSTAAAKLRSNAEKRETFINNYSPIGLVCLLSCQAVFAKTCDAVHSACLDKGKSITIPVKMNRLISQRRATNKCFRRYLVCSPHTNLPMPARENTNRRWTKAHNSGSTLHTQFRARWPSADRIAKAAIMHCDHVPRLVQ
jgi:hypothetical protein